MLRRVMLKSGKIGIKQHWISRGELPSTMRHQDKLTSRADAAAAKAAKQKKAAKGERRA